MLLRVYVARHGFGHILLRGMRATTGIAHSVKLKLASFLDSCTRLGSHNISQRHYAVALSRWKWISITL